MNPMYTFGLHNRKVFVKGESYAGYYVPYFAVAMLYTNDTTYYGVESILIYDVLISTYDVHNQRRLLASLSHPYLTNSRQ